MMGFKEISTLRTNLEDLTHVKTKDLNYWLYLGNRSKFLVIHSLCDEETNSIILILQNLSYINKINLPKISQIINEEGLKDISCYFLIDAYYNLKVYPEFALPSIDDDSEVVLYVDAENFIEYNKENNID